MTTGQGKKLTRVVDERAQKPKLLGVAKVCERDSLIFDSNLRLQSKHSQVKILAVFSAAIEAAQNRLAMGGFGGIQIDCAISP
jgi:hypothetical protein